MSRWIKVDVSILSKPAIRNAARDCGVSVGDAFAAWFRLYSWLDEQTADGTLYSDHADVDAVARLPGFAASLERSGWLAFQGDVLTVANWGAHNGSCAKRRAMEARRQCDIRDERRKQGLPVRPMPKIKMPVRR